MRMIAKQSGQAMVFVYFFIGVVIIGLLVLFNSGQLTRQKMEVQNAADAAAYSAALLSARYMNYVAYTNRAMIANEVAIGQFSAFNSWGQRFKVASEGSAYGLVALRATGIGNIFATGLQNTAKVLNAIYSTAAIPMTAFFSKLFSNVNYVLNHVLGVSQQLMRAATLEQQWTTTRDVIEANAPGATISNFGAMAALFSQIEQFLSFSRYTVAPTDYSEDSSTACEEGSAGEYDAEVQRIRDTGIGTRFCSGEEESKRRFVAIVNDSRDNWTRDRRSVNQTNSDLANFGIDIDFRTVLMAEDEFFGTETGYDVRGGYSMGFGTRGGTALRYLDSSPETMLKDITNEPAEHEGDFGWSSLDTVRFGLEDWNFTAKICVVLGCGELDLAWLFNELGIDLTSFLSIPLAGASSELAGDEAMSRNFLKWADAGLIDMYGDAWSFDPWSQAVSAYQAVVQGYQTKEDYKGLAPFTSVDQTYYGAPELEGGELKADSLKGPAFIVGVRKNLNKLRTSEYMVTGSNRTNPIPTPSTATNQFHLTTVGSGMGENNMPESGGEYADTVATEYAESELQKLRDQYEPQPPPEFDYLPPVIRNVITDITSPMNAAMDSAVGFVSDAIGDVFGKLVEEALLILEEDNSNQPAIYALASARIFYKNPGYSSDAINDPGSAFSPYWEARSVPVDDDVKKWSLFTQDNRLVDALQTALNINRSPDSYAMDKHGVKNHIKKLAIITDLPQLDD